MIARRVQVTWSSQSLRMSAAERELLAEIAVAWLVVHVAASCGHASWPPDTASATSALKKAIERRQRERDRAVVRVVSCRLLSVWTMGDRATAGAGCGREQARRPRSPSSPSASPSTGSGSGCRTGTPGRDRERVARRAGREHERGREQQRAACSGRHVSATTSAASRTVAARKPPPAAGALVEVLRHERARGCRR